MLLREAYVFVNLLGEEVVAGKLQHHRETMGLNRYFFVYGQSYLKRDNAFSIDPRQLPLSARTFVFDELPLAIQDAGPDEFGRLLYTKTHGNAQSPLDYHMANGPFGVGALALSDSLTVQEKSLLVKFDALHDIVEALELLAASKPLPERLENLLHPGSSLPGARPKALLIDDDGEQWIAKFGRDNDIFDIQIAETAAMSSAALCGIRVAEHRLERVDNKTVYLAKRFDRDKKLRKHFLSAYTLMGADRVNPSTFFADFSYPRLSELVHRVSGEPGEDCRELFTRMVFNACCGNKDDHLKNHGFLMERAPHYRLSPAYDIVPGAGMGDHAIGMGDFGPQPTLQNVLSQCGAFKLTVEEAQKKVVEAQQVCNELVSCAVAMGMNTEDARVLQSRLKPLQ